MWKWCLWLWDWLGRLQVLQVIIGGSVTALIADLLKAPAWVVFTLAIAGACIGLGLALFWQQYKSSRKLDAYDEFQHTAELFYGKRSWLGRIREWWGSRPEPLLVMPSGYISMRDAARKVYEAAKAGEIPFGEASEQLSGWSSNGPSAGSPEDILHWWAGHIAKEVPVYGRRPPSSVFEEIPSNDVKHFIFADEATKLKDPIHDAVYYTDIAVKLNALDCQYNFEAGFHGEYSG